MSFDQRVALCSAIIGLLTLVVGAGGFVTVIIQLRNAARQREADSMIKLFDINRELLSLGFADPRLFAVLEGQAGTDALSEKRYLQLWLNLLSLMDSLAQHSISQPELKTSLDRNLVDFFSIQNMRKHWKEAGKFYPTSFQHRVDEIIKKVEPPIEATQPKSGH